MRFTIQYIPLSQIKHDNSSKTTLPIPILRRIMLDCMHLMVVRKHKKDGSYTIVHGRDHYEFLRKYTNKRTAPCLVDTSQPKAQMISLLQQFRNKWPSDLKPDIQPSRLTPASWSIIRTLLKEEPKFKQLSRFQQFHIMLLAIRYKRTVVESMKSKIYEIISP